MDRIILAFRYRFFFFAGIFPFLLGQIIAFHLQKSLNWHYFWWGFFGVILVLSGVELFNEYFDAKAGGDRIFSQEKPNIPNCLLSLALYSMLFAFFIGLFLSLKVGWPILLFSILGFLGAYFYVGPPIKWAYRGFGELVIALSYGPFMVLGSYYLQTKRLDSLPLFISLILGLSLFSLAILNEIPDYYQDRLVGKKNIVVRLGKEKSIRLLKMSLLFLFILLGLGVVFKKIPLSGLLGFLTLPWLVKSLGIVQKNYENPRIFIRAINANLVSYLVIVVSLCAGWLIQ